MPDSRNDHKPIVIHRIETCPSYVRWRELHRFAIVREGDHWDWGGDRFRVLRFIGVRYSAVKKHCLPDAKIVRQDGKATKRKVKK